MSRRIVAGEDQVSASGPPQIDGYFDRILKYIPGDVVAAWVAMKGVLVAVASPPAMIFWIALGVGLLATLGWTYKQTSLEGRPVATFQILVSGVAFLIWVAALGGSPFGDIAGFEQYMGSLALIAFTVVSGLLIPKE